MSGNLTRAQMEALRGLEERRVMYTGYGCTNMTMNALAKRGLAKFKFDNPALTYLGEWQITPAGKAAILAALPGAATGKDGTLGELLANAIARFKAMTPEQREAHLKAQRESWARGEVGMGSDKDEAEYRAAIEERP